jgi:hypothetical protein
MLLLVAEYSHHDLEFFLHQPPEKRNIFSFEPETRGTVPRYSARLDLHGARVFHSHCLPVKD